MRKYVAAATVMAVALLGLAGCTDDDPAPPEASPSLGSGGVDPPSSSATPDPTAGLTPEQVVRAWFKAYNMALHTGDTADALALTASQCNTCDDLLQPITEVHAAGGTYEGGDWRIVSAKRVKSPRGTVTVSTAVEVAAGRTSARSGAPLQPYDAEGFVIDISMKQREQRWALTEFLFLR